MINSECLACTSIIGLPAAGRNWYDEPLVALDSNVVVAAVGPLAEGHVLVLPRTHVPGSASLPDNEFKSLWECVKAAVSKTEEYWDSAYVFEHGGSTYQPCRSSCFDHAHVHVVPGVLNPPEIPRELISLHEMASVIGPQRSYLLWGTLSELFLSPDPGESQFLRRHILRETPHSDQWDYAVFPRWDVVGRTISKYRRASLGPSHGGQDDRHS